MKIDERVQVFPIDIPGRPKAWETRVYRDDTGCWIPVGSSKREDIAEDGARVIRLALHAALEQAYERGRADGARAENNACAKLARGTEKSHEFVRVVRERLADAIAARREAAKPADEKAPPGDGAPSGCAEDNTA